MTPYEIMLSESQERMLLVAERGREREVFDVFHKWGLDAVEMGRVTDDGQLRVLNHGAVAAEIPAHAIAEQGPGLPAADCRATDSERTQAPLAFNICAAPGANLTENFRRLLASPTIASKKWITEQYDSMVRTNTRVGPGAGDAAVLRLKETKRALALSTDGNGRWCYSVAASRRDARGGGSGAQRGVLRRAAHCRDELPEFRQSRKAGSDVAVQRSDRRNRRSLPRARNSDHRRQRELLQ